MKKPAALLLALVMCLILCSCSNNSGVKESQILSDMPERFLTIERQNLNYDSIEVSKRNTEDGVDDIYFTLEASNDDYEATAQCHFQYNYYSEGGWILDYAEIVNGGYTLVPLNGYSDSESEEEYMQENYMNHEFVSSDFGSDNSSYYTECIYEASNEWAYYSQNVSVDYIYTFETGLSPWEYSENVYCYDISTCWSCDKHEDIISDNWVLDLDVEATHSYDGDTINLITSPSADGSNSVKYYANELEPGFLSGWDECEGEGTAEYEVKYSSNNGRYISFVMQLYDIRDDGSLDYDNPHDYKVWIFKDYVHIKSLTTGWIIYA